MAMEGEILVMKHVEQEGPGLIGEMFDSEGWRLKVVELWRGDALPATFEGVDGVIVLGGPMNVYEEARHPFLKQEDRLITRALIEEVPLLGICLGAQLLSKACSGTVTKAPRKEVGWYHVKLTDEGRKDRLFEGMAETINVFQWHEDTFEVPQGGVLLATGKTCRNQAFRMGNYAYGLQFHLEAAPETVEGWMKGEAGKIDVKKILSDAKRLKESVERQATQLVHNFKHLVESSMRIKKVIKMFVEDEKKAKKKRAVLWWSLKEHALVTAR
jgi:GMP synthase (glutamine-hydrolysing)